MSRLDSHNHFWRYRVAEYDWIDPASLLARDYGPAELTPLLDASAIDAAIAVQARETETETEWLLDLADAHNRIAGVVGWVDLPAHDVEQRLDGYLGRSKLVGLRYVIQDEPDDALVLSAAFVRGVRAVLARGWTYDILIRARQARSAALLLERVGPGRLVLDHCAKPAIAKGGWEPWASEMRTLAEHPNLYCKLSGLVTEAGRDWSVRDIERYIAHAFEAFGTERVMFGSDWPVCLQAASYREVVALLESFVRRHCPRDQAAIFGGNAARAYGLDGDPR